MFKSSCVASREAWIGVGHVDEGVALECHLVRCDLIGPVIFAVVQGDNAAQLPAIGPEVAHDKGFIERAVQT